MAAFTLDAIRAAADAKYGSTDIELNEKTTVHLLNPLRLPKEKRAELSALQEQMEADGADQEDLLAKAIVLVADHPKKGEELIKAVNGDLALLAEIFETYGKGAQVGGSLGLCRLIDDYGEGLYADLRFHYGIDLVDVIEGRGPSPMFVMALVRRLPDTSLTVALASGGREHFGWGVDRHLKADLFDALNQNTRATGQWGKGKVPKFPAWPRPAVKKKDAGTSKKDPKRRVSVAEIYKKFTTRR
ncbi:tail assembly chaperone [Streptomyces phage Janus]|uniref:Tail assembly chaperone n=1 Tax=Streptomyces phage Janus TaxID=2510525 RepID=A0A411CPZ9_9CAUD|nr:tail assembly chaperone [Streptomyces phage Janus]QAY15922.1 tail assembly chaperone [Streptomyces phage Janus]